MAGETEQGVMSGAASGAATGASIPGAGLYGAAVGAVIGGVAGFLTSDSARKKQREAQKKAEAAAEKVRREGIIKQMGAKAQADSLTMTASNASSAPTTQKSNPSPGTVGPQVTAAGTF